MLLDDIRQKGSGQYNDLKLYSAVVNKKQRALDLCFASPQKLSPECEEEIRSVCEQSVGNKFAVSVKFIKDYFDENILKSTFVQYLKSEFFFLSSKIDTEKISVEDADGVFTVIATVTPELRQMLEQNDFIDRASGYFKSISNYEVKIKFDVVENPVDVDELMKKTELMRETQVTKTLYKPQRKINVENVEAYIDRVIKDRPQYIIDITQPEKSITVCGKLESIKEVVTPNGYTLFKFDIADFTGQIGVVMFSKDEYYLKLKELVVGDELLINGQVVENSYTQELELRAYRICRCKILADEYEQRVSRPVPADYVVVSPEPFVKNAQENLFESKKTPKSLQGKTFVVFDFETTGKSFISSKIIELGAVRIVDGEIVDMFSTFINPECKIPREITELTGIIESMVENAPTFPEIIADFYKYCDGAILVGHNIVDFDGKFLKFNTKDSGYIFSHPQVDTLAMSRKYYKSLHNGEDTPHNFKLGTLADFLGVKRENAHRAVDDSIMTADVFLKLAEKGAEM